MVLKWGCDDETTPWGFTGQNATNISYFFTKVGIKQVYICPELNFGAAVHADKWIPILPNTDAALQLAIIYVWLKEDLWDKEYVASHAVGMDKVAAYVLGEEDGVPKTPEWASKKTSDPRVDDQGAGARVRQAVHLHPALLRRLDGPRPVLARARPPRVHPARHAGPRRPRRAPVAVLVLRHATRRGPRELPLLQPVAQSRPAHPRAEQRRRLGHAEHPQDADPGGHPHSETIHFSGTGAQNAETEDQFIDYQFPNPPEEGGTRLHMIWTDTPCRITCWNHGNWTIEAHRDESIEFCVAQHPWLENDCLYADIILPANTTMEVEDVLTNVRQGPPYQTCMLQEKAIEPVGESKSDYEIVLAVAEKLGHDGAGHQGQDDRGPGEGDLRVHARRPVHDLGRVQGEEVRRLPDRRGLGGGPSGPARVLRGPRRTIRSRPRRACSSSTPSASRRTSPTTRNARASRSGSRRASRTTSASRASARTCSR